LPPNCVDLAEESVRFVDSRNDGSTGEISGMGLLRQIFGPSKDEIWADLSRQIGAEFVDGGFWKGSKVIAREGPWTVTLDTYTVSTGKSSQTYTRLRAPYVNRDGFRFEISRTNIFTAVGLFFGMQDIEVGDSEFDRQFVVKSDDPEQVRKLLANPKLRELMLAQPSLLLRVVDDEGWFGDQFPEGVDEIYFIAGGVLKNADLLKGLFELFSETLQTLCEIGSAYETPPFASHDIPDEDRLLRSSEPSESDRLLRSAESADSDDPDRLVRASDPPIPTP
jgi:hypothetical protein